MKILQIEFNNLHQTESARANVLIIYTGGTFGMSHDSKGVLVPFDFASIVDHLPTIRNLGIEFTVFTFDQPIDSSNVSPEHWMLIASTIFNQYALHDGFVVLHGTDTMAYTASALSFMLPGLAKPVVLTGAQLPIIDPRSDARENLITALEIAAAKKEDGPLVPEVCIYFDYVLLRGNRSRKVESMQFDAFDSGNYPPLAKAGVKIDYNFSVIRTPGSSGLRLLDTLDNRIAILKLFPGITPSVVQATLGIKDLQAVIIETYGSGNAPTSTWLIEAFTSAVRRGIILLNISQCPGGTVVQGRYETSKELQAAGVISGADMTTEAALAKLMVLLGNNSITDTRTLIQRDLAGEITG